MQIGIGLDGQPGLSRAEQRAVIRRAVGMGYANAWTNSLATGRDAFHTCAAGAAATFKRLAVGLDEPIVRVVSTRPGLEPTMAALEACRPDRLAG
jgi:hypothetical protein